MEQVKEDVFSETESNAIGYGSDEKRRIIHFLDSAVDAADTFSISKCVNKLIGFADNVQIEEAINILERQLFRNNGYYLSEYLFRLYDKLGNGHMARFYLQYCYGDLLTDSGNRELVYKYIFLTPKCVEGNYFDYNGDFVYRYDGKEKGYGVHSFSNDIGLNLTLLVTPYGSIIFDCGSKSSGKSQILIEKDDLVAFLSVYGVEVKDIVAVIISHAHLDHYGSIYTLLSIGISPLRFYSDMRTVDIIKVMGSDAIVDNIRPISMFFQANQRLQIHSYDNGHIPGSQLLVIRFDNITVVYTGDFCLHDQHTVSGLDLMALKNDSFVSDGVDCLITESTYGRSVSSILPYEYAQKALKTVISKLINCGYKILLPSFAMGRSQELMMMLSDSHRMLVDGRSIKLIQVYENILKKKVLNSRVKYYTENDIQTDSIELNDIIIVGSSMISQISDLTNWLDGLFNRGQSVAMIRTGHMDNRDESYGYGVLREWRRNGVAVFDIPLPAHADYEEIFELIDFINPKNVVAVHGPGLARSSDASRDKGVENYSSFCPTIEITDGLLKQKWKNAVITGNKVLEAGEALDESQAFLAAFKLLVRFIKKNRYGQEILNMLSLNEDSISLFSFLKNVYERDFVISHSMIRYNEAPDRL